MRAKDQTKRDLRAGTVSDEQIEYADLECPCCGDVAAEPDSNGMYYDTQPLTCGCSGCVAVDEDGNVYVTILCEVDHGA